MICAPRREPLKLECASPEVAKPLSASPWKSGVCLRRLKLPSPRGDRKRETKKRIGAKRETER